MKKAIESLQDLIEEAKLRTVWWILCIFGVTYFLTHTSKSMLMNIPIAILFVSGIRILLNVVEFRWKVQDVRPTSYLSHLEKKQLSVNDSRLTTQPLPQKWKRKIDSPVVEAAAEEFINKILHDFVIDLWYSEITPDKEAPELIHDIIMDALGEVSGRIKDVNLVELLTRDAVDLVGEHLDLFRRTQAAIGVDVMGTLSSEERDERLKHQLLASKELHPALISADYEYKVLQRLMGALLAVVLRPRDAQSPLVRCIARELLVCLVMQPVMNFASPWYINELIECIILAYNNAGVKDGASGQSPNMESHMVAQVDGKKVPPKSSGSGDSLSGMMQDDSMHTHHADWAKAFDAATQRRTEVLMPENLENMWAIGRNYKKKIPKGSAPGAQLPDVLSSPSTTVSRKRFPSDVPSDSPVTGAGEEDKTSSLLPPRPQQDFRTTDFSFDSFGLSKDLNKKVFLEGSSSVAYATTVPQETKNKLKRSNSTSDLKVQPNLEGIYGSKGSGPIINEYYSADTSKRSVHGLKSNSDVVLRREGLHGVKLRCRVVGAYFEKLGSKSFAVYSIAVSDADNNTWFVKRRYRNFERLHRHLKDIPNYTLHLPPKRIFSSSTEDAFVLQRCIQLDKYLQELLTIANVAEQHEVWDFLSDSSKNYSFGKSPSVMRTLAVNVDDAMDDLVRQFKGVSDGLIRKGTGSPSSSCEQSTVSSRNVSWNADAINKLALMQSTSDSTHSFSDNEDGDKVVIHGQLEMEAGTHSSMLHSDHEFNSKGSPNMGVKHDENINDLDHGEIHSLKLKSESTSASRYAESNLALTSVPQEDLVGAPPEWTPPNLSVPILNLVDKIFQLKRRGWLRRQVFWISKQILQLVMEDAIDDWLLRQIQWLRREDVIAQGIRWIQDVLWPDGVFFIKLRAQAQSNNDSEAIEGMQQSMRQAGARRVTQPLSFEQQLEAARRANDVKQMLFHGAPTTLVSLIGHNQYRLCARDINYFLQSTVCLKQLGYGILELVLVSVFPELRDVVIDIHQKMHDQSL